MITKQIKGYEDKYEISNIGQVFSFYQGKKKKLKPQLTMQGRLSVILYKNKKPQNHPIHRLVALAFIPNPLNLPFVLHKDNNPINNNVKNLKWGTQSDNLKQAYKENRLYTTFKKGEKHHNVKITEKIVSEIRTSGFSGRNLAKLYQISPQTICDIKHKRTWRYL